MVQAISYDELNNLEDLFEAVREDDTQEDVYVFPVSFAQERLWFLDQFEPGSPYYNIPTAVRLSGRLHVEALERALNEIVRRHESLRTTFATLDGDPVQVVSPSLTLHLPLVEMQHLPEVEREAKALQLATDEARCPFDLSRGPLLRATLLRLDVNEHLVLLTMHHIVSDGWSMGVFIEELTTLYRAFSLGRPSPLRELPIQYADFALWQREWLQGEVLEAQLEYWRRHLGGVGGALQLPTDRSRPAIYTSGGAVESLVLPKWLTEALQTLGREERATSFMTLLAAFQTLLHRYSGQARIDVGSPIANRSRAELEELIGFFVNTLVLRADFSGDPTFRQLLRRVREMTLGAYAHQDVPFEMLVDALQVERDMSHTPLFQVMFILQNAPTGTGLGTQDASELTLSQIDVHSGTSTFDLTLSMAETAEGTEAAIEYNTDLFDAATIVRMLVHFQTLLEGIVVNPDGRVSTLPLVTAVEREQLSLEWNDTAVEFAEDQCVHELFEQQVARTPEAVAVVVPATESEPRDALTYRMLNQRANRLAHYLRKLNVGPETVVGVCIERSVDMIVSVLAVLKAGGAYLPLDPLYPQDRLAYMLKDSAVPVLLTQTSLRNVLPVYHGRVIYVDADGEAVDREDDGNPVNRATSQSLVYMIYTSGSTGQSKGVMIEHRSLVNAYLAWEDAYDLREVHSHLQMANFSFDVFSGDLVRALCSGGKLVVCPREWLLAPERLFALMCQERVDCAEFVPAVLRHLIQYLAESEQRLDFVQVLACGSDSWYAEEYRRFLRFCGRETRLINSFGLTEACIDSCYFESSHLTLSGDQVVPIGRPFSNMRLYILDDELQLVPVGVTGELCVGGLGVARGYRNRADLTADRFIPDPFDHALGARLYRTGDMARYRPDGNVEFLGRLDHQIKIRGFRIEPGEIEAAIGGHPAVQQAAVVAVEAVTNEPSPSLPMDKRLAAYIVPVGEPGPTDGELRRFLQESLPDYMVPSAFVFIPALPLTPNGKVDRDALPTPDWSRRQLDGEYVSPRTATEEMLVGIWTRVLGVERVGVRDDFFGLGGHSLLATQVISRMRETLRVDLPLRNIFEAPTVEALAERVEISRRAEAGTQAPPIKPISRDKELPLSFAQQRLWFLDQLEPGSPFYNIPEAVRLVGPLDAGTLSRSLDEVVRRHEALRTTFNTVDGKPIQVIAPKMAVPLLVTDLRDLPKAEREDEALRLAQEEAQKPFDLSRGPLLRARLLRLSKEEHIILLTMHHVVGDNWSTQVLVQEVAALYDAFSSDRPSPLPELAIQYADFAYWQRNWLQGEILEAQLSYWKEQLARLPPLLELPTDRPRPPVQSYQGDYQTFRLPADLSRAIKNLCQQEGATLFMVLLAALQTLLYRYSGQDDISVGSPIANRNRREIEDLIGFFVNTLVLRADFSGNPSFRDLLERVRETALGAYAHQDLPFEMIVDALQPERNLSHSPLFQVMFALQSGQMQVQSLPDSDLTIGPVEAHSGTAKFDLTLFVVEEEHCLSGALEYNTDLFDGATIQRMLRHFKRLLEAIVTNPDQSVADLPLLSDAERRQLLVEWNATRASYPQDRCAHELFEAQVRQTPDAVAVTFSAPGSQRGVQADLDQKNRSGQREEEWLTYAELNRRANQLAHYLQKRGVGAGTLVAICAERSPQMMVGLLGILKAGGAYLPLDPTYPPERLSCMLEDAHVPVLLTQERLEQRISESASGQLSERATLTTICLDSAWSLVAQGPDTNLITDVTSEDPAYVIYTSGSTGQPKGAIVRHMGLVNYLTWCQRAYPLMDGQGAPVHSSISFDLTITGLFAPLMAGRPVMLLPEEAGVEALGAALRGDSDYSLVKITPSHLELLSQQLQPEDVTESTQAFIIGGENLLGEAIAFWQHFAPRTVLVNEYGPTETVVGCCVYQVPRGEPIEGSVPIGRPIINTQLYILDQHLHPVAVGVPGELYIGGDCVGQGYLNRPELTAERFIPDPFGHRDGARLYRTGDRCRYLPDGNIEFLGRTDFQVKIRGFRIELGEIEAVLSRHPAVAEAVAVAREYEPGHKRLVAYVVPEGGAVPTAGELRSFLGEKLPDYLVPSAFVTLEALPLTPNGKVDRQALPAPDQKRMELQNAYVPPRTPAEHLLSAIWADILQIEPVGVYDNFFNLGGDSILSIQVIARARNAGLHLTPRHIFQHPTIAELVAVAREGPLIDAEQDVVMGAVPLTPIQRWFFETEGRDVHHWNQALLLQVEQSLDPSSLESAIARLVEHHDALRLRFERTGDGSWEQTNIGTGYQVPVAWVDLSAIPSEAQGTAVERLAAEFQASLNLAMGPLLRVAYFDLGPSRMGRFLIVIHHLVIDGVSWRILLEDLQRAYEQSELGATPQLPPKTTSFQYWAQALAEYAASEEALQELDHWLTLSQRGVSSLPVDFPDGLNTEACARSVIVSLDQERTRELLQEVPSAYRTEISDVLLTALAQALEGWTGQPVPLVAMEGHGRESILEDVDVSRTVGWFTSLYPVHVSTQDASGPGEALTGVKEQLRRVPHRGIGYGILRYLSDDEDAVSQLETMPEPELSFNYLGRMDQVLPDNTSFRPARESRGPDRSPSGMRSYLLEVDGGIIEGRLQFEWTYSEQLHRRRTIEQVAQDFIDALEALIAHCLSPDAGGYTASDFAEFGWDQGDLEDIVGEINKSVEQIG